MAVCQSCEYVVWQLSVPAFTPPTEKRIADKTTSTKLVLTLETAVRTDFGVGTEGMNFLSFILRSFLGQYLVKWRRELIWNRGGPFCTVQREVDKGSEGSRHLTTSGFCTA